MSLENYVNFITDGESVNASVANRVPSANARNIAFLRQLLDESNRGSALYLRDVSLDSSVDIGDVVYSRESDGTHFKASASLVAQADGRYKPANSSIVAGLVVSKNTTKCGDLLLIGSAVHENVTPSGVTEPGLYYLSDSEPGSLTLTKPLLSVPVLFYDAAGRMFLCPHWLVGENESEYYVYDLYTQPATGAFTIPNPGGTVVIENPDSSLPGWLPADDAIFGGNAPAGAVFGYNLSEHPELLQDWPPIPAETAYLEMDRPLYFPNPAYDTIPYNRGYKAVSDGVAIINADGLWWTEDGHDQAPFDSDYETLVEAPNRLRSSMRIWYARPTYFTSNPVVSSIRSIDDRIQVLCRGKDVTGSVGNLDLKLALELMVGDQTQSGHIALKEFDHAEGKFLGGPVVEGLQSASSGVFLSSTAPKVVGESVIHQGIVSVSLSPNGEFLVPVSEVRLNNVSQETYQDVLYLGLPAGKQSKFRSVLHVPAEVSFDTPKLRFVFWLLGRTAGTLPALSITYRVLPTASGTPQNLPTSDTALPITTNVAVTADQYFQVASDPIDVTAGNTVLVTLSRDVDAYAGEVGVLRQYATIAGS